MLLKLFRNSANNIPFYIGGISLRWNMSKRSFSTDRSTMPEEQKVNVDGVNINCLRVGTGEHPVLLLPGAAGSIWTDFKPQIEGLSREKFTVVAWDPPGYGKSRPPDRTFPDDFFQRDADWACNLMKTLGHSKFSLIGWSDGAITSLMIAAMFPGNIRKMIAVAGNAYITPEEVDIYKKFRDIDSWSEKMRAPMIAIYGEEYFRKIWTGWVDSVLRIYEKQNGNLCKEMVPKIKCPTLIVQGAKDAMVLPEHPTYLKDSIVGAKLKIFEKGAHNLHLRYPEEFNDLATKFLIESRKQVAMLLKLFRNSANNIPFYIGGISLRWNMSKRSFSTDRSTMPEEQKVNVDGVNINCLRVGTGEHPVLLLPGAAGSIWTDFKPQIEGLSREKFTVVAWDPPGYGKSRPPDRTFPDDFFQRDADWACNLMKTLGHSKFSLIGWSDGAITSLMIAAMFPGNIRKMIAVVGNAYITPEEVDIYKKFRDIDSWSEKMRAPMIAIYGEEYFRKIWTGWVDSVLRIYEKQNGNLCKEMVPKIKCPTLIVQGAKDAMVLPEHPTYLKDSIVGAKLKIFEKGAHNLHLRYPEEFNDLATKFLIE
ncbi:uncharacterized protein LOC108633103 [Ceratina calcarata]|uniref:Uncharacterized protein LOC108633103 n=1 Tax=Ceratina calcarata TaxID=156304 RepID=A0AAJ7RW90_9HYME|nr:uncharacterized protein LOC108633103 [Ceratina calcarata]